MGAIRQQHRKHEAWRVGTRPQGLGATGTRVQLQGKSTDSGQAPAFASARALTSPVAPDKSLHVLIPKRGVTTVPVSHYILCISIQQLPWHRKHKRINMYFFKTTVYQGSGCKSTAFLPTNNQKRSLKQSVSNPRITSRVPTYKSNEQRARSLQMQITNVS